MVDATPSYDVVLVAGGTEAHRESEFASEGLDEESKDFSALVGVWYVSGPLVTPVLDAIRCSSATLNYVLNYPRLAVGALTL